MVLLFVQKNNFNIDHVSKSHRLLCKHQKMGSVTVLLLWVVALVAAQPLSRDQSEMFVCLLQVAAQRVQNYPVAVGDLAAIVASAQTAPGTTVNCSAVTAKLDTQATATAQLLDWATDLLPVGSPSYTTLQRLRQWSTKLQTKK
jgi:hypothetical protein